MQRTTENPVLIPLSELPAEFERRGLKRVAISTLFRWVHRGLRGRRLRTLQLGRSHYTTWQWVLDLCDRKSTERSSDDQTNESASAAADFLDDEGL